MPASWATSSRRSPGIRRRGPAGSPPPPRPTPPPPAPRNPPPPGRLLRAWSPGGGTPPPDRPRPHRPGWRPVDLRRETDEPNVFGVGGVTNALLPLVRRSAAGRIVGVSSALGSLTLPSQPDPPWGRELNLLAYQSSKTALNAVTVQYAAELRDTPILVNAADPGYCATDLNGHRGHLTAAQGAAGDPRV